VLRKIRDLVRPGATVLGPPPSRSPSLENYPRCEPLTTTAAFRAGDKAPEFWWPDSGRIERPAVYDVSVGIVRLPLTLGPNGSVFVVFRNPADPPSERIVSVTRDGGEILGTALTRMPVDVAVDAPNTFAFAAWVKPADGTTLVTETNRGVVGLGDRRNDALAAPHGDGFGGAGHAGCGLAVGTNGVCVFEHGANYFAPTLVHAATLIDWTHVTVVYDEGQPTLYLDGVQVRTGLRSEHVVHSGFRAGGTAQFRGQLGSFEPFARALDATEVAELFQTMPRPDRAIDGPGIEFSRAGAEWIVTASIPGEYSVAFADGGKGGVQVAAMPSAPTLTGSWDVRFTPGQGAPEQITFDQLTDWIQHHDPGIRHYSGSATYRKTFEVPSSTLTPHASRFTPHVSRFLLDLGEVRDLAVVRVNGHECGTLWLAPWKLDITSALRAGANELEIEVINVWNNRLVGDQALPPDQRHTFLLAPTVNRDAPLLPAGLFGPVTIETVTRQTLPALVPGVNLRLADPGREQTF
jgi:hypothetical protein